MSVRDGEPAHAAVPPETAATRGGQWNPTTSDEAGEGVGRAGSEGVC